MSDDALDIYSSHLAEQLGEDGVFTESAIYDPSGDDENTLYGVFDDTTIRENKDSGNVTQFAEMVRFVLKSHPSFDVYTDKQIYLPYRAETYTINYVDKDKNGADILWLI